MVIGHVRNVGKSTLRNGSYVSRVKYQKKEFNPLEMRVDNLKTCWRVIGTVRNVVHIILHGETDVMHVVSRATDLLRCRSCLEHWEEPSNYSKFFEILELGGALAFLRSLGGLCIIYFPLMSGYQ